MEEVDKWEWKHHEDREDIYKLRLIIWLIVEELCVWWFGYHSVGQKKRSDPILFFSEEAPPTSNKADS